MGRDRFNTAEPTIARDALLSAVAGDRNVFPFQSWAVNNRFDYPPAAGQFFCQCESAAEAFFVRPFTQRQGVEFREEARKPGDTAANSIAVVATLGDVEVALQVRCALFRLDVVARRGAFQLAIEVDGMTHHRLTDEQIAADYIRQRRIVALGYTVVRFTAREAFANADECWRQIDAILASRTTSRSPRGG